MFRFLCGLPISYRPIWNLSAARPGHFFQVERSRRRSIKAGQTKANGRSIKAGQPQWPFYLRWAAKDGSAEIAKSPAARPSYFYQAAGKASGRPLDTATCLAAEKLLTQDHEIGYLRPKSKRSGNLAAFG